MEASQNAEAVLGPPLYELQLVRLRPKRMMLRWLVPLVSMVFGTLAILVAKASHSTVLTNSLIVLVMVVLSAWWGIRALYYPMAGLEVIGTLALWPEEVAISNDSQGSQRIRLMPGATPVVIDYHGYQNERIGRNSLEGYNNFITIDHQHTYRFWAFDASVVTGLQNVLRSWYAHHIPVKEYCQDSRTFLLERDLSYEQIQAYKKEFGVSLFN